MFKSKGVATINSMKINLKPGKYVVAVSGGVDSMVLLNMLSNDHIEVIVAHLDHGIRPDSFKDRRLVQKVAQKYGFTFEYEEANLGAQASEALARENRYKFLQKVKEKHKADAIITAHHQDDLLETAILNMLRGSGRKGLTSLGSSNELIRPLLNFSKQEILKYAKANNIEWREDSTNEDTKYLRNYLRKNILSRFSEQDKKSLLDNLNNMQAVNDQLDSLLLEKIKNASKDSSSIKRRWFNSLPHNVACEVMASWLRQSGINEFDKKLIEKIVIDAKVNQPGKQIDVRKNHKIYASKDDLSLK